MTTHIRTQGAQLLASAGAPAELARRLGVTPSTVSRWLSGESLPSRRRRVEIASAVPTVPVASWASAVGPDASPNPGCDELGEAVAHLRSVQGLLASAATPAERGRLLTEERRSLELCARLSGALAAAIDEKAVLGHPKFRAMLAAILAALAPHPEALAAVQAALEAAS